MNKPSKIEWRGIHKDKKQVIGHTGDKAVQILAQLNEIEEKFKQLKQSVISASQEQKQSDVSQSAAALEQSAAAITEESSISKSKRLASAKKSRELSSTRQADAAKGKVVKKLEF